MWHRTNGGNCFLNASPQHKQVSGTKELIFMISTDCCFKGRNSRYETKGKSEYVQWRQTLKVLENQKRDNIQNTCTSKIPEIVRLFLE